MLQALPVRQELYVKINFFIITRKIILVSDCLNLMWITSVLLSDLLSEFFQKLSNYHRCPSRLSAGVLH
jgi:hypothetical protein